MEGADTAQYREYGNYGYGGIVAEEIEYFCGLNIGAMMLTGEQIRKILLDYFKDKPEKSKNRKNNR
jgi:hypothetical protein